MLALLRNTGIFLARLPRALSPLLVLGWMGLIFTLSSLPSSAGGGVLGRIHYFANLAHSFEYGMLALWACLCLPRKGDWVALTPRAAGAVFAFVVLYAGSDEWHQLHVPGRDGTPFDLITDAVGAASVLWIIAYCGRPEAEERGLLRRLLACLGACLVSATFAAYHYRWFGT